MCGHLSDDISRDFVRGGDQKVSTAILVTFCIISLEKKVASCPESFNRNLGHLSDSISREEDGELPTVEGENIFEYLLCNLDLFIIFNFPQAFQCPEDLLCASSPSDSCVERALRHPV